MLLHEELREVQDQAKAEWGHEIEIDGQEVVLTSKEAKALADVIERDYRPLSMLKHLTPAPLSECVAYYTGIPAKPGESIEDYLARNYLLLPRYEDDEPVPWGAKVANQHSELEAPVDAFYFFDDGEVAIGGDGQDISFAKGELVKRPKHTFLDADGVEIKVGDVVYVEHSGFKHVIERIENGEVYGSAEPKDVPIVACSLTHEKPVFDANGERIKVGDTVWYTPNGSDKSTKVTVIDILKSSVRVEQEMHWTDSNHGYAVVEILDPKNLTHREPDSFLKVLDRLLELCGWDGEDSSPLCDEIAECASRMEALIERGA